MNFDNQDIDVIIRREYRGLLRDCGKHIKPDDLKVIREALNIVIQTSASRIERNTGLPIVIYSILIARVIAGELGLGKNAIVGALLTDIISETDLTDNDIEASFGAPIAELLRSLSKISTIDTSKTALQADSFRRLILNLAGDVQVLLIKFAERVILMRNLEAADKVVQVQLATESRYIHSPLAHRLGLYNIKSELDDLSLKYLNKESYFGISNKLKATTRARNRFIREFIKPIKEKLDAQNIKCEIKGRLKSVHSIWSKMEKQKVDFDEVFDLFAIRIIIDGSIENERSLCWQAYSVVTDLYTPNPERLRDWISIPKTNGYESLHTTVASPRGRWVEVQIRTDRMNEIAEKGFAAHWRYKGAKSDKLLDDWLKSMREILESPGQEMGELVDQVKLNLYSDEIFVFTPRGDLKRLPKNATLLDFAFEIHSEVGAKCTGGTVNSKNVSIRHILRNGDLVEIITSKSQKPKRDWLKFVVTSKAKTKIKQTLNEEKTKEADIGKEILKRRLRNWKLGFNDTNVKILLNAYDLKYAQDLYYFISQEKIGLTGIKDVLTKELESKSSKGSVRRAEKLGGVPGEKVTDQEDALEIDIRIENVDYKFAKCCKPEIGDRIFGFVTISEGIKVHRMDCPNANQLLAKYPYRIIQTRWSSTTKSNLQETILKIKGKDDAGLVNSITELISKQRRITMQSINFTAKQGSFEGELQLRLLNKEDLDNLLRKLMTLKGVTKVTPLS